MHTQHSKYDFSRTTNLFVVIFPPTQPASSHQDRRRNQTMSEPEELSKNALKKKLKAEEAAKKKAAKDAEKAAKVQDGPKKEKLGGDEVELDPTQYYENRLRTVNNLGVGSIIHRIFLL